MSRAVNPDAEADRSPPTTTRSTVDATDTTTENGDRRDWRSIARILAGLLLLVLVVPFVVHAVPAVVGADASYVVLSGSMEPAISPGDSVLVADVSPDAVERGDVITFATGEPAPTTHRVVDVVERTDGVAFRTKGDANPQPDGRLVTPDRLRGEVVAVIPLVGYVLRFGATPHGRLLLLGVPVGLLVVSEAWSVARDHRRRDGVEPTADDGEVAMAAPAGVETVSAADGAAGAVDVTARNADEEDESDTAGSAVELTRADLRVTLAVLALLAAYSASVAVLERSFWSVGVAVAATGCLLSGVALWYAAPTEPETGTVETATLPEGPTASVPAAELLALAARTGATVYRTPNGDFFVVSGETVVVAHAGGDES